MKPTHQKWNRFFRNLPWAQDPLADAMALWHEHPSEVYGPAPVLPGTVGKQLDALELDHKLTYPGSTAQRIRWLQNAGFVDVERTNLSTVWLYTEVARVVIPVAALGVIERVATYLRVQATDREGVPDGPPIEYSDQRNSAWGMTVGPPNRGTPCPFPIVHPSQLAELDVRFDLRVEDMPDNATPVPQPFLLTNGRASQLPTATVIPTWRDGRYAWGARYTTDNQWVMNGHVRVRLFVGLRSADIGWEVKVGGLLAGLAQLGGPNGEAKSTATTRY